MPKLISNAGKLVTHDGRLLSDAEGTECCCGPAADCWYVPIDCIPTCGTDVGPLRPVIPCQIANAHGLPWTFKYRGECWHLPDDPQSISVLGPNDDPFGPGADYPDCQTCCPPGWPTCSSFKQDCIDNCPDTLSVSLEVTAKRINCSFCPSTVSWSASGTIMRAWSDISGWLCVWGSGQGYDPPDTFHGVVDHCSGDPQAWNMELKCATGGINYCQGPQTLCGPGPSYYSNWISWVWMSPNHPDPGSGDYCTYPGEPFHIMGAPSVGFVRCHYSTGEICPQPGVMEVCYVGMYPPVNGWEVLSGQLTVS